jgi:hypothetical protein
MVKFINLEISKWLTISDGRSKKNEPGMESSMWIQMHWPFHSCMGHAWDANNLGKV